MEWWWIDYLENELSHSIEADLLTLLEHSEGDRVSFEQFRQLKQWIRESDPVESWPVEERTARMHSRVMAAVNELDGPMEAPETTPPPKPKPAAPKEWSWRPQPYAPDAE